MLKIECQEHYDQAIKFAEESGRLAQLQDKLDYLDNFNHRAHTRCRLFSDFAPYSFEFVLERVYRDHECGCGHHWSQDVQCDDGEKPVACPECGDRPLRSSPHKHRRWFNGGLLFYDRGETGVSSPQFSVRLDSSSSGWEIHT